MNSGAARYGMPRPQVAQNLDADLIRGASEYLRSQGYLVVAPGSAVGELLRLDSHQSTQFNLHLPTMVEAAADPAVQAWVKAQAASDDGKGR